MMLLIALEFTGANLQRDLILVISALALLAGGILFLIFYGIQKKKKVLWLSGLLFALLSVLAYMYFRNSD